MGIQGLLPLLKSIQKPCSLKQFAGQTLGVDAYGWLHRGTVACAVELATGKPTSKYVDFAMSRVRMLKHFGITPYLIFDGANLPSKQKTEKERSTRRKESKKLGLELLNMGKTSQAYLELQKSVDVTPEMAGLLIQELKREGVKFVVAPYEADSQMVYLEKQGVIDGILSEDSDLLVFGAKNLLTKLDQYGECVLIRRQDFTACKEVSFVGWSDREFRQMAILSGCDYLDSIDKMGLKTAYRLLRKHRTVDKVIRAVGFEGKLGRVPVGYLDEFVKAELTFLHQWVYCTAAKGLIHLSPLDDGMTAESLPFIGKFVDAKLAGGVARGELHPHTKEPLVLPVVASTRRWMGPPRSQKQAVTETPDLKRHKSIDSFFKPNRTPLAELSVNLFTGSPAQQEMARRASGSSWPATPVDHSAPGSVIARPSVVATSVPVAARRAFSEHSNGLRRTTSERAPKRQRLCPDGSSPVSQKVEERVEYTASKFFGGSAAATPSKQAKGRSRKSPVEDFTVFSDASMDEALSQLPLTEGFAVPPKKVKDTKSLAIFEDSPPMPGLETPAAGVVEGETQITTVSAVFSQDQTEERIPESPPSQISISAEAQEEVDEDTNPFANSLSTDITELRRKFAFSAATSASFRNTKKTNVKLKHKPQKYASRDPPAGPTLPPQLDGTHDQPEQLDDQIIPGSDAVEPSSPVVSIKRVPESPVLDTGQVRYGGGSEDLLVSESEVEAASSELGSSPGPSTFALGLGRFAFGAI